MKRVVIRRKMNEFGVWSFGFGVGGWMLEVMLVILGICDLLFVICDLLFVIMNWLL
jgi:hypothetical protein